MHKKVEKIYLKYLRKYFVSMFWFMLLNLFVFALTAISIFLSAYAIKKNNNDYLKILFVVLAILSAFSSFITGIMSFFAIRKHSSQNKSKIQKIKEHKKRYNDQVEEYEGEADRDKLFIQNILEISQE